MDKSLRGFLAIGFFVGGTGFLMVLVQPRDSAEYIASICSGIIGFTLIALVLIARRVMQ